MEFVIPDFVVVGATYPNGRVMLLASKTLTDVELKKLIENPEMFYSRLDRVRPPKVDIKLIAEMDDYIEVWGDSYSEAWQTLFSQWAPGRQELSSTKELPR